MAILQPLRSCALLLPNTYAFFVTFFDHCICFEDVISFLVLNMLHFDRRDCNISQLYSVKQKNNLHKGVFISLLKFQLLDFVVPSKSHSSFSSKLGSEW